MGQKKLVCIVVPMPQGTLMPEEEISMKHLRRFLAAYDKYFVMPNNLDIMFECNDFIMLRFHKNLFRSRKTYSNLLISKEFYRHFVNYEYILIYQLDSLVFSDQLIQWCKKGYDYIGAPWIKKDSPESSDQRLDFDSVGNGGFCLRKVESHLKVLNIYHSPLNILGRWHAVFSGMVRCYRGTWLRRIAEYCIGREKVLGLPKKVEKRWKWLTTIPWEDRFWSIEAKKYYNSFSIPSPEEAVSFSFEEEPQYCFTRNNSKLPFGCHDWTGYDRKFWEPYLLIH